MSDHPGGGELRVGGTLDPRRNIYIERAEDVQLLELLDRGEYCNILSSRQVGKSSLIMSIVAGLVSRGKGVVVVDVAGALGSPESADDWYCGLLGEIARQLGLLLNLSEWWASRAETTANQRLLQFFRQVLLPRFERGLVIFLDEIDHTLKFAYTDDFFTVIRTIYNDRPREPLFERVTFCLAGVATPNELIKTARTTAYNVGKTFELSDFDIERHDLSPLARVLSTDAREGDLILRAILAWTGGHPYLTLRLCEQFRDRNGTNAADVDAIVGESYQNLDQLSSDVHFQQITRFIAERLADGPATLALYERILSGNREPDKPTIYHAQLKLSGLVKRDERGDLVVRNRIYASVFGLAWVRKSQPRQTVARYRRVALLTAALLLVTITSVALYQIFVVPPRVVSAQALAELQATSNERIARDSYQKMLGNHAPRGLRWVVSDYPADAKRAYRAFWERRAATLEARALERLKGGRVEEACVLGAAAAVKRDGTLDPDIQRAFDERQFAFLRVGFTGLHNSDDPNRGAGWYAEFSFDGRRLLLNPYSWGSQGSDLVILDAENGQPHWRRYFEGLAFLLADGRGVVQFRGNDVHLWQLNPNGTDDSAREIGVVRLPKNLERYMLYQADTHFLRERVSRETGLEWLVPLFRSVSRCIERSHVGNLERVGMSSSGNRFAVGGDRGTVVCDLKSGQPVGSILPVLAGVSVEGLNPFPLLISADGANLVAPPGIVVDVETGVTSARLSGFGFAPRFVRNGEWLLFRDQIVSTANWRVIQRLPGRLTDVSPDGRLVAAVAGGSVRLYERQSGRKIFEINVSANSGSPVLFSPDGKRFVVSGLVNPNGPSVSIWNVTTERQSTGIAPREMPGPTPAERWQRWQTKFGLTLDENDEPVPLWRTGPRQIAGLATETQ